MKPVAKSLFAMAIALAAAGTAFAAPQEGRYYGDEGRHDGYGAYGATRTDLAQVIRVDRISGTRSYERQECWNEQSRDYDDGYYRDDTGRLYRRDGNNKSGAVIGAIVGGALGNQVGKGDGRKAATVAGAVIGATIGNSVQDKNREYEYSDDRGTIRRCRTVYDNRDDGYYGDRRYDSFRVTYRYAGQTYTTMTDRRPGRTIRVLVSVRPQDSINYYGSR